MLTFEFELASTNTEEVDGLSRGHITVHGRHGSASSKGGERNESVMIFVSLVDLSDGIRRFLLEGGSGEYNFVGAGSSFQLFLRGGKDGYVLLDRERKEIDAVSRSELVHALWNGLNAFMSGYGHRLDAADAVADDLSSAVKDFRKLLA